jgi:hypothetical protein
VYDVASGVPIFANGAVTAAYGSIYNALEHQQKKSRLDRLKKKGVLTERNLAKAVALASGMTPDEIRKIFPEIARKRNFTLAISWDGWILRPITEDLGSFVSNSFLDKITKIFTHGGPVATVVNQSIAVSLDSVQIRGGLQPEEIVKFYVDDARRRSAHDR